MTDITIKNVLQLDGIKYLELSDDQKDIVDKTFDKITEWHDTILSFNNERVINIISNDPNHTLVLDTTFPEDLAFKIFAAFVNSR